MNPSGPIVVIEDVKDDQENFFVVFRKINYKNAIVFFGDGEDALESCAAYAATFY